MKTFRQLREDVKLNMQYTEDDAHAAANALGLQFIPLKEILRKRAAERNSNEVCIKQFVKGLNTEIEHIDITGGDLILTAKIVLSHLRELPDYYNRLDKMEKGKK
jgi:hypothetical protein